MADTGRTVFADGFFADGFFAVDFFAADEPVSIPDVVGETQAAGTATLEGAGFVVAVSTAYSSTVPAGTIISQVPAGGTEAAPGSTVTITVSLGDQPQQETGGGFWPQYDRFAAERRRRKREEEEAAEAAAKEAQDELERETSRLLREKFAKEADAADLQRLQRLADEHSGKRLGLSKRVSAALINAYEMRSRNALEQLLREIDRADEEEMIAVQTAVLLLLD